MRKVYRSYHEFGVTYTIFRGIEQASAQAPVVSTLYWKFSPKYYRYIFSKNFSEYEAPIDPCRPLYVDPSKIRHCSGRDANLGVGRRKSFATVQGGEWDIKTNGKFEDLLIYRSIKKRFIDGYRWEQTEFFDYCMDKINEEGEFWHGSTSEKDVRRRCEEIDMIYENIKSKGYLSQFDLNKHEQNKDYINMLLNEVTVDIGRDGQILFVDGRHRLSISKILGIDKIPVICVVRHNQWMKKRDEMYKRNIQRKHPDLLIRN